MEAVIFDLDGTLLDRDATLRRFLTDQYDRHFSHIDEKECFVELFMELDQGGYVSKSEVYDTLQRKFDWLQNAKLLLNEYKTGLKHYCVAYDGVHKMLDGLYGRYKLAVLTNGTSEMQSAHIRALGIEAYFDCILISETEGMKKPEPDLFSRASNRLEVPFQKCVFVGDHPENDIAGAQNVGMKGYWKVNDRYSCAFADEYITHFNHLVFTLQAEERMTG
ncbi:HAD family hydrolase [Halobacillus salinus]|uniref:HAD family hydrolase n=1 Tax=Halobacillus salinus TaxID=192814 RepID=A0A4Z0H222_9BACI|nr:HAD family hydrolase [Halobacillus salinus]TGB04448.1 HAD family hydrolase [Halobacillus salinus]